MKRPRFGHFVMARYEPDAKCIVTGNGMRFDDAVFSRLCPDTAPVVKAQPQRWEEGHRVGEWVAIAQR